MHHVNLCRALMVAGAMTTLAACADYGGGVGYVSDGPGYAGDIGFGGDYYGGFGYPGYGYYNDFYYPGSGFYVFDRGGHRRRWTDGERAHWQARGEWRGNHLRENGRFDQRRDHGYMTDRRASFQNFQRGVHGGPGGGRPGGGPGRGGPGPGGHGGGPAGNGRPHG